MSIEGVRVVRGPDWNHGNKDGGEGHVGTVTQDNKDDTVEVRYLFYPIHPSLHICTHQ